MVLFVLGSRLLDLAPFWGRVCLTSPMCGAPGWACGGTKCRRSSWIVTLTGTWFVEVMDGKRVELGLGELEVNAQGRKGHHSGHVGDETVMLMVIELDVTPTVDRPAGLSRARLKREGGVISR